MRKSPEDLDSTWNYLGIGTNIEKGVLSDVAAVRQCSDSVAFSFDVPRSAGGLSDDCDPNSARRFVLCQKFIDECANVAVQNGAISAESQGMRQDDGKKKVRKSRKEKGRMHECLGPEGICIQAFITIVCEGAND